MDSETFHLLWLSAVVLYTLPIIGDYIISLGAY